MEGGRKGSRHRIVVISRMDSNSYGPQSNILKGCVRFTRDLRCRAVRLYILCARALILGVLYLQRLVRVGGDWVSG